ncbi:MAG: hypothetical protein P8P74_13115 [Crocinitomicaceae bacterium]|nr:hypothetical protein [Crocinitomicaceae bacterium]
MRFFVIACTFALLTASCAKSTFSYGEGMCNYVGKYDPKKISEAELQNTLDLLIFSPYPETRCTAWELDEIEELDLNALEEECNTKLTQFETLSFPNTENIVRLKESRIRELNERCALKMLTIIAYDNPDTLMSFATNDPQVNLFRNGLIKGGDTLVEAWREVVRIQKSRNARPERIQAEFEEQFNSPEKLEYAQLAVMMFGWWNHANHIIYTTPTEYYAGQFELLFSKVEEDCDF